MAGRIVTIAPRLALDLDGLAPGAEETIVLQRALDLEGATEATLRVAVVQLSLATPSTPGFVFEVRPVFESVDGSEDVVGDPVASVSLDTGSTPEGSLAIAELDEGVAGPFQVSVRCGQPSAGALQLVASVEIVAKVGVEAVLERAPTSQPLSLPSRASSGIVTIFGARPDRARASIVAAALAARGPERRSRRVAQPSVPPLQRVGADFVVERVDDDDGDVLVVWRGSSVAHEMAEPTGSPVRGGVAFVAPTCSRSGRVALALRRVDAAPVPVFRAASVFSEHEPIWLGGRVAPPTSRLPRSAGRAGCSCDHAGGTTDANGTDETARARECGTLAVAGSAEVRPIELGALPPGQYRVRVRVYPPITGLAPLPVHSPPAYRPWERTGPWDECATFSVRPLVDCEPPGWTVVETDIGPLELEIPGWDEARGLGFPGNVEVVARAYVPNGPMGPVVGPLVVFTHGRTPQNAELNHYASYDELGRCLARNGFIFVSVRSQAEDQLVDPYFRARFLIAGTFAAHEHLAQQFGFDFSQIDGNRLAFMGHSRGGEAVAVAARLAIEDELLPDVFVGHLGATIALAPANNRPEDFPQRVVGSVPAALLIAGSADTDTGLRNPAQEYDSFRIEVLKSLASAYKGLVQIDGATHFAYSADQNELVPGQLLYSSVQTITAQYVVAFLRWRLLGDDEERCWFVGEATPFFPPAELGEPEAIRLRLLFRQGNEAYVTPLTDIAWAGEVEETTALDPEVGDLPLGPDWPHGASEEADEAVQTNYLWVSAAQWEAPIIPQLPVVTLGLQGGGGAPLWIRTSPIAPGDPRLSLRFDAVRWLAPGQGVTDELEQALAVSLLVHAFDDDGNPYLLGAIDGIVIDGPNVRDDKAVFTLSTVVVDFAQLELLAADPPVEVPLASIEIQLGGLGAGGIIFSAPRAWYGVP